MTATPFLDDPSTPARLKDLRTDLAIAVDRDDRGRAQHVKLQIRRLCASIREEVQGLRGRADPELLIALWSTAQMTHARGREYAGEGAPPPAPAAAASTLPATVALPMTDDSPAADTVPDPLHA